MQAWHNDPSIRQRCISAVSGARENGRLRHSSFCDEKGDGCAVGHMAMAMELDSLQPGGSIFDAIPSTAKLCGLPIWLMAFIEAVYERELNPKYHSVEHLLAAIPVGLDLPDEIPDELNTRNGLTYGSSRSSYWTHANNVGAKNLAEKIERWIESQLTAQQAAERAEELTPA